MLVAENSTQVCSSGAYLFHHLVDEDPEGGLGNIVPRVLTDVVGSQSEDLHVVITETLQLLVEGWLEDSFEQVKSLSNTRTTSPVVDKV